MTTNCLRLTNRKDKKLRIYAGNLPHATTEQEVREAFEAHGVVNEVALIKDRETGRSKGFAFVEMPTAEEAQAAIASLNGKDFSGRTITVNEAKPRAERSFGGGGGGFGGGDRRGGGGGGFGGGDRRGGGGGGGGRRDGGSRGSRW
jgi:cold-inducible RNA-binding protein